jgi:hypothetical protein
MTARPKPWRHCFGKSLTAHITLSDQIWPFGSATFLHHDAALALSVPDECGWPGSLSRMQSQAAKRCFSER